MKPWAGRGGRRRRKRGRGKSFMLSAGGDRGTASRRRMPDVILL